MRTPWTRRERSRDWKRRWRWEKSRRWGWRITLAVAITAIVVVPATVHAQNDQTFIVEQGSECVQITPLGDGTRSVEAFYDYRSPSTVPEGSYASYGTGAIQQSQTSQLFVYAGTEGLSLVFLHDKFGDSGGFAATADITGLPATGKWVIEDDSYAHRDDVFDHTPTSSHIEWVTNGNRTDGAAFRGLGSSNYRTITVDIAFNEESNRYPFEEWQGSPEQNQIERWIVRSGSGETTELDMSKPVEISPGTCSGGSSTFTPTPGEDIDTTSTATDPTTTPVTTPAASTTTTTTTTTQTRTPATTTATRIPADETTTVSTIRANTSEDGPFGFMTSVVTALAVAVVLLAVLSLMRQGN